MRVQRIALNDIPEEGSTIVPFFGKEIHVYRVDGVPRAVANVCMHLGGPLECKDGEFVCPWHGARFDVASGQKIDGPAPQGARLMRLPTVIETDALFYVWGEA